MTSRAEHSAVAPTGTSLVYLRTRKKVDEVAEKRSCKGMVGGKVKRKPWSYDIGPWRFCCILFRIHTVGFVLHQYCTNINSCAVKTAPLEVASIHRRIIRLILIELIFKKTVCFRLAYPVG